MKNLRAALCFLLFVSPASSFVFVLTFNGLVFEKSQTTLVRWTQHYGGVRDDVLTTMTRTADGGFALAGYTGSYGFGTEDYLLIKTNSSGNLEWSRNYGGMFRESVWNLLQTEDEGFLLVGAKQESINPEHARYSLWVVKTDLCGNMEWNRSYLPNVVGDSRLGSAWGQCSLRTNDRGFLLLARATANFTYDEQTKSEIEDDDFWLVKIDSVGNVVWNQTYDSGSLRDWPYSVIKTSEPNDEGYAIIGFTSNINSTGISDEDFWLVKTDLYGSMQWNRKYDGSSLDRGYSILEKSGVEGYFLLGPSMSNYWIIKVDKEGSVQWDKNYPGPKMAEYVSAVSSSFGGYVSTWENDFMRIDDYGSVLWRQDIGEYAGQSRAVVMETAENEYVVAGSREFSNGNLDFSLTKLSVSETSWTRDYLLLLLAGTATSVLVVVVVQIVRKRIFGHTLQKSLFFKAIARTRSERARQSSSV